MNASPSRSNTAMKKTLLDKQNSVGKIPCSVAHFTNPFRSSRELVSTTTTSSSSPPRLQRRVGLEDELLKKNRKVVDNYLRRVGALMGKDISLNSDGMGYFSHGKFVVLIEVPSDCLESVYIYTLVCRLEPSDNIMLVLQKAMRLNYLGFGTRGSTLGWEGDEINLSYSTPISSLSFSTFQSTLEGFLLTAFEVNEKLDAVKHVTGSLIEYPER